MDTIRDLSIAEAREVRRDALARVIAAEKMLLTKDPLGQQLPYELWSQMLPQAESLLHLVKVPT